MAKTAWTVERLKMVLMVIDEYLHDRHAAGDDEFEGWVELHLARQRLMEELVDRMPRSKK